MKTSTLTKYKTQLKKMSLTQVVYVLHNKTRVHMLRYLYHFTDYDLGSFPYVFLMTLT